MSNPPITPNKLLLTACALLGLNAFCVSALAVGPAESASRKDQNDVSEYVVQSGDTLGEIAASRGITLDELMRVNGLDDADTIYAGQKLTLPYDDKWGKVTNKGVIIEIPSGFNLTKIADAYKISVSGIVKANKLTDPNRLRAGQKILIPGAKRPIELVPPPPCYSPKVEIYRVRNDDTAHVSFTFCNGRVNPDALETLSKLSAPPRMDNPPTLHPRLALLLQKVAKMNPGKRIEIISAYRSAREKGSESLHNRGQAIDFRVAGVSNKVLSAQVRGFDNVGVGYYPNSVFIHLDTRDEDAYWVDYSRPGERAIYGSRDMTKDEIAKIRETRSKPVREQLDAKTDEMIKRLSDSLEAAEGLL